MPLEGCMIRPLVTTLVDLAFPRRCLLCSRPAEHGMDRFCDRCSTHLSDERAEPACPTCGSAIAPFELSGGRCADCRRWPPRVKGTVRVGPYAHALGRLVKAYKYRAREEFEPILGEWLAEAVENAPWLTRIEGVVSVPTHWMHRFTRPLHAADSLASIVAKRTRLPHLSILRRTRAGPHQIGLSYSERADNVRGAFALRPGVTLKKTRLLVIDDVKTTGATLEECAKVLRRSGAAEVYAAVVLKVGEGGRDGQNVSGI